MIETKETNAAGVESSGTNPMNVLAALREATSAGRTAYAKIDVGNPGLHLVDTRPDPAHPLRFNYGVAVTSNPDHVSYALMMGWSVELLPDTEAEAYAAARDAEARAQDRPSSVDVEAAGIASIPNVARDLSSTGGAVALHFDSVPAATLRKLCETRRIPLQGTKRELFDRLVSAGVVTPVDA